MSVNDDILDAQISHQIGLLRYSNSVLNKIIALLNRVDDDLIDQISKFDALVAAGLSQSRLKKMLDALRVVNKKAHGDIRLALRNEIRALGIYEAEFQQRVIVKIAPVNLVLTVPTSAQVYAATMAKPFQGILLKEMFAGLEQSTYSRLRNAIRMGYVEGQTTDEIIQKVRGRKSNNFKDGILEGNRNSVAKVIRTALGHTAAIARDETYNQNAHVIKGVGWVSTLDGSTTQQCRDRDGKAYTLDHKPIGHGLTLNGGPGRIHWLCRSSSTPILKSWKELGIDLKEAPEGTRASMDGQVPAKTTYYDWLKSKPASFQDNVLGRKKALLFRNANLPPEKFIDRSGKAYTLDQLKVRETKAWDRAGLQ